MAREHGRPATIQATEWIILGLCLVAVTVPFLTGNQSPMQAAWHAGTAPTVIIAVLTGIHVWARRTRELSSSKYLAMFSMVLAVWLAMSGFLLREEAGYSWAILVVGSLIFAASLVEAFLSPPSEEGHRPLDPRTQV